MKKFFATKWFFKDTQRPDDNEVDESMVTIDKEVQNLIKEIDELEKELRIESKVAEELEKQFKEETDKNDAIDKDIEELLKEEKILAEDIERKEKEVNCLKQEEQELHKLIETLEREDKRQTEEFEKRVQNMVEIRDGFQRQLQLKAEAYQSLNEITSYANSGNKQLEEKWNHLIGLKSEVEELEKQIQELKEKKSIPKRSKKSNISSEAMEYYSDVNRVIVSIAEIKVDSNRLQSEIDNELSRRQSLVLNTIQMREENSNSSPEPQELQKGSAVESDLTITQTVATNVINIFEVNENIEPNTSSVGFGLFSVQSLESNPFEDQTDDRSESITSQPETRVSLFGNQSAATSSLGLSLFGRHTESPPQNVNNLFIFGNQLDVTSVNQSFNLFGNQRSNENINNESGFGFSALFNSGDSEAGDSTANQSENSFAFK